MHQTTDSAKNDHGRLRQKIVEKLLADVFRGRLQAGRHLVTQELADRFRVSHTPIREALIALAGIGIIDLLPNRGAVVRRVTKKEVREVMQVRRALECEAVRLACGRIHPKELRDVSAELERLAESRKSHSARFLEQSRRVDSRLHDLIADSCGNRFLAGELNRLKTLFRAFRDVSWSEHEARNDLRRLSEEAQEHLAIVEALGADDTRGAVRAMSKHLRGGLKYWARVIPEVAEIHAAHVGNGRVRRNGTSRNGSSRNGATK
ncbi:MAG TPA: GntR family transcriptional regulator [Planctomycetaceae bacterium]|nr:GntR family transcriptional regulator [Planctomycetaceae bacterium]